VSMARPMLSTWGPRLGEKSPPAITLGSMG
jgi:hypothetical protein